MTPIPSASTSTRPGFSPVTVLLLAIGILLFLALLWAGRIIFLLLFAAIVVAVLLTAIVDWLKARFHLRRTPAFALILVAAFAAIVLAIWIIGPKVIEQFSNLQTVLPQAAGQLLERMTTYSWGRWMLTQWSGYSQLSANISDAVTRIGGIVVSTATVLSGLVLVAFLGLYMAAEPDTYVSGLRRAIPKRYRTICERCAVNAVRTVRWWLLSKILSMIAVGLIATIGLWLLGVPLAITLGIIAGLLTFIPNLGPILSVVPAALLGFSISPTKGVFTVLLFLLVHFLEGNIITPLLERKIVSLPPALTLTVQLLLAVIAGPLGVALAAPLTAAALGTFQVLLPKENEAPAASTARAENPLSREVPEDPEQPRR